MTGLTILILFGLCMSLCAWRDKPVTYALLCSSIGCTGAALMPLFGWSPVIFSAGYLASELWTGRKR